MKNQQRKIFYVPDLKVFDNTIINLYDAFKHKHILYCSIQAGRITF